MYNYDTLSEAAEGLRQRGFTTDFNLLFSSIECKDTGTNLSPEAFEIIEHYRFEGETDPSDESVVYGIAAKHGSMKGVLVNAYGTYSDTTTDELIKKLTINE